VIARTGRIPRTVTADRGYGEAAVDQALHDLGVTDVVIPAKADPARPAELWNTDDHSVEP
jgi:IS5 family transposase